MALLAATALTLADWAARTDPDGKPAKVAELLSQTNEILLDAVFKESNQPTSHQSTVRTGLPAVYWRSINQGVPPSKSTTAKVVDSVGLLEAFSLIDEAEAELNGNTAEYRLSEDAPFIEAMNQVQAQTLFYGNPSTDPKQYLGLAGRYGQISGAGNAVNILDAGGTGSNNTSIWLVFWGENTAFCTFPKGTKAGLEHSDDGLQTVTDASGGKYKAWQSQYKWRNGLVVKDWRYIVRIANINVTDLVNQTGTQAPTAATNIIKLLARALYRVPNQKLGRGAYYMNKTVHSGLAMAAMDKSSSVLAVEKAVTQFGQADSWLSFIGVPLRQCDQLLNTEARVV